MGCSGDLAKRRYAGDPGTTHLPRPNCIAGKNATEAKTQSFQAPSHLGRFQNCLKSLPRRRALPFHRIEPVRRFTLAIGREEGITSTISKISSDKFGLLEVTLNQQLHLLWDASKKLVANATVISPKKKISSNGRCRPIMLAAEAFACRWATRQCSIRAR